MASKRRGGFRPPELRGTLGTLLRTTTGVVRDALERGAREGRARFDDARATRRRHDALADLGELVLDLIRRGEIDLAELPEAHDLVRTLDDFDAARAADEPDAEPEQPRPASRRRFDDRPPRRDDANNDGTVSSGATLRAARPTIPARPNAEPSSVRAPTKPIKGIGRPRVEDPFDDTATAPTAPAVPPARPRSDSDARGNARSSAAHAAPARTATARPAASATAAPTAAAAPTSPPPKRSLLPHDAHRKGGISFDDDDLNEYMHPDDVPPKTAPNDPDDRDA